MTTYFIDTSALAKRYVIEKGTVWVAGWIDAATGNIIVIAETTPVEMLSVLTRRRKEGTISATDAATLENDFLVHLERDYLIVPMESAILLQARTYVKTYTLRALDSIQLASAEHAKTLLSDPISFISADNNLLAAAAAEGFVIDNPNNYP